MSREHRNSQEKLPFLTQIRVQLTPKNSVSWGVRRFAWILAAGCVLALSGCGAVSGVQEQVKRETFAPTKATVDNIAIHVYLDRSGSAQPLREDNSKLLLDLLDLYPESVDTTLYWYSQECIKLGETVSSRTNLTDWMDKYVGDVNEDEPEVKGTNLSTAFRDLQTQATRDSGKQVIGVFVSDGGFEDDQSVLAKETEVLRDMPNVSMLIFVGLDADGTKKLTVLDDVVRDRFVIGSGTDAQKQFFGITLENGGTNLAKAKEAVNEQIAVSK